MEAKAIYQTPSQDVGRGFLLAFSRANVAKVFRVVESGHHWRDSRLCNTIINIIVYLIKGTGSLWK